MYSFDLYIYKGEISLYIKDIYSFVGKKFLFKVKVTNSNIKDKNPTSSISRMTSDEDLMNSFMSVESKTHIGLSNYHNKKWEKKNYYIYDELRIQ